MTNPNAHANIEIVSINYPKSPDGTPDFEKRPSLKRYLNEQKGAVVGNVWSDIQPISSHANERTGYPTQKPLVDQHPCYDGWNAGLRGNCLHGPNMSWQRPCTKQLIITKISGY